MGDKDIYIGNVRNYYNTQVLYLVLMNDLV